MATMPVSPDHISDSFGYTEDTNNPSDTATTLNSRFDSLRIVRSGKSTFLNDTANLLEQISYSKVIDAMSPLYVGLQRQLLMQG
jgi:hypothetical protein